jgi:hypothetical protein
VVQERERAGLHEQVVAIGRAAHERRTDAGDLVAHAEAELIDEEAPRRGAIAIRAPVSGSRDRSEVASRSKAMSSFASDAAALSGSFVGGSDWRASDGIPGSLESPGH